MGLINIAESWNDVVQCVNQWKPKVSQYPPTLPMFFTSPKQELCLPEHFLSESGTVITLGKKK